jgi:hypothetical protein
MNKVLQNINFGNIRYNDDLNKVVSERPSSGTFHSQVAVVPWHSRNVSTVHIFLEISDHVKCTSDDVIAHVEWEFGIFAVRTVGIHVVFAWP